MRLLSIGALCWVCFGLSAQVPSSSPQPTNSPESVSLQSQLERMRRSLRDYGNLARYRDEDAKLAATGTDEDRVVFMGDSITDFWGRQHGRFFPGKPYINRGISGQVTPQMLLRFYQDVIA